MKKILISELFFFIVSFDGLIKLTKKFYLLKIKLFWIFESDFDHGYLSKIYEHVD